MAPLRVLLLSAPLCALAHGAYAQPTQPAPQPSQPIVRNVVIVGATELGEDALLHAARIQLGEPLPATPAEVAEALERHYQEEGYSFAHVGAVFDEPAGALTLTIDEGRIDDVEFTGVDEPRARTLAADFALRAGDVFNWLRATDALRALLRPSRGALRPGRPSDPSAPRDSGPPGDGRGAFDIIEKDGRRVLVVGVDERGGAFRLTPDMGDREDWFTPVDGLVPSLGFGGAVFDQKHFNHAYIAGHLSYKMASRHAGYALGLERPLFAPITVYVGAELYDLSATDDTWQISGTQASLSNLLVRTSFRDYYRRRGLQFHAAVRPRRRLELLFAWRGERHETLGVESDFSIWNGDEAFRPNSAASDGRLNALIVGASWDSAGFDRESLAATYRRHQLDTPFGERLANPNDSRGDPLWRLNWTTEVAARESLGGDFDFRRHIVSGRAAIRLSRHEEFRARVIGGWSQGMLPPQRQFAIGGIGTVHGYGLKEAAGDRLALVNLEYALGRLNGLHIAPFFDAGRVAAAAPGSGVWLKGVGFGVGFSRDLRVDFGYRLDDIPGSLQVLFRLGRTF